MFGMDGLDNGFMGLLSGMFKQQPGAAAGPGEPMQILPDVQRNAQDPSMLDQFQSGVNKNADSLYGLAGGLLNQKPAPMQAPPMQMNRPRLPMGIIPTPMKWGR